MIPLSEKLRPKNFEEIAGQEATVKWLTSLLQKGKALSLLFFGPPGSGKTTLAGIYAFSISKNYQTFHPLKQEFAELKKELLLPPFPHVLFVDEIHRLNKVQQSFFLPLLEKGEVLLIGATTENPSFVLHPALLSRLRACRLSVLKEKDFKKILERYEGIANCHLNEEIKNYLFSLCNGDARHFINLLENLEGEKDLSLEKVKEILQKRLPEYGPEVHYDLISALHKSVRGSDPDAALYWFHRMMESGEDPLYICRRLVRMASEDIGLADPHALSITLAAHKAYEMLGSPEGELALAEAVIYLALSPKSNAVYTAYGKAKDNAKKTTALSPPRAILNAPTKWMEKEGYGEGYIYDHDTKEGFSGQEYFPEGLPRESFYKPIERGFEREMKKRLDYFNKLRLSLRQKREEG